MDVERIGIPLPCCVVAELSNGDRDRRLLNFPLVPGFDDRLTHLLWVKRGKRCKGSFNSSVSEPFLVVAGAALERSGEVGRVCGNPQLFSDWRKKPLHEGLRPSKTMARPFIGNSTATLSNFTRYPNESGEHDLGLSSSII